MAGELLVANIFAYKSYEVAHEHGFLSVSLCIPTLTQLNMPFNDITQVDLSHHLSEETQKRLANPMKHIMKMTAEREGMLSLANGMPRLFMRSCLLRPLLKIGNPHHSLYPISQIDFHVPKIDSDNPLDDWRATPSDVSPVSQQFTSFKDRDCSLSLRVALQYSDGAGTPELRRALANLNQVLHSPPHNVVTLSLGNSDSISKCFRLFGSPGDTFLAEEFSFPGMTNVPLACGIKWAPVRMDSEGIIPEKLEELLATWNEAEQGKRPHVLYTIP